MKTFEELKEELASEISHVLGNVMYEMHMGNNSDSKKTSLIMSAQNLQNYLDFIDEVTTIEIGADTNALIKFIESNKNEFIKNFDNAVIDFRSGPFGILMNKLGLTSQDLECFRNNILANGTADNFRQLINANFGTNIPLSGVLENLLENYNKALQSGNDLEIAQAFVNLREAQRDAGVLSNGGVFNLLAYDKEYQHAKELSASKTL